ncbi:hypothetical protein H5410_001597, partial [Solanum commersonii]
SINPFLLPEVVAEILSRLPVKCLSKFSPEFVKSHMSVSFNKNIKHRVTEESNLDYLTKNSAYLFD